MSETSSAPYTPSWVDRLTAWIDKLPGKSWMYYVGSGIALFLVMTMVSWIEASSSFGSYFAIQLFFSVFLPFCIGFIFYLDDMATRSLKEFQPVLETDDFEYELLQYRLTTLPPRPALISGLILLTFMVMVDIFLGLPSAIDVMREAPISFVLLYVVYKTSTFVFGTLIYHTIHQLRWVNRIYTHYSQIDLFDLGPLHSLSKLTALTAGGIILVMYLYFAVNPGTFSDFRAVAIGMIFVLIAVFTFIWPLRGAHGLIKKEKERLLHEGSARFKALSIELHRRIETNDLKDVGQINAAMAGLETERIAIKRISTWPWQPETLRTLVTTILAPIGIWLLQYVLSKLM